MVYKLWKKKSIGQLKQQKKIEKSKMMQERLVEEVKDRQNEKKK